MQNRLILRLLLAASMAIFVGACSGPKARPELSCRTPDQLKEALAYALNANDTNFLWQLYAWTNVAPVYERFEKKVQLQFHPHNPGDWSSFKSFRIVSPVPPYFKELASQTDPTKPHYNIPVQGIIYCNQKMREGSRRSSFEGMEFPFGQMPDGTYLVAVMIKDLGTNAPTKSSR